MNTAASVARDSFVWRRRRLVASALIEFVILDFIALFGFKTLARVISQQPTVSRQPPPDIVEAVTAAVKSASVLYVKKAHCLQRSAAVTRLLRRNGVKAQLLIGCQSVPFRSHAWVEVDKRIISDGRSDLVHFRIIDRW